jgi:transcription antitermination factor NusG
MRLHALDIPFFLPMNDEVHQWSDRKQVVSVPLFPGYLFVHIEPLSKKKLHVVNAPGVVGFVGNQSGPLPIPDSEIESIRTMFTRGDKCRPHAFLKEGDRVRMVRGPLIGIEGTLLRSGAKAQLVISINIIQRSVAVTVSEHDVEPVLSDAAPGLNADPPLAVA